MAPAAQTGTRAAAVFSRYEVMDNVNWYYFSDRSPILRFSLRYDVVLAFGIVGLWLARRDARRHRVLSYFLLAAFVALMCKPPVIGRYRLAPTAVLLIYAGGTAAWFDRAIRARHWGCVAGAGMAVGLVLLVSGACSVLTSSGLPRRGVLPGGRSLLPP